MSTFTRGIIGAALALLALAPPATADPTIDVCALLDADPTITGVSATMTAVEQGGIVSAYDAGQIVAYMVIVSCPEHRVILDDFVGTYDVVTVA